MTDLLSRSELVKYFRTEHWADEVADIIENFPPADSATIPRWVKILANNWRGRNGNTTTGDSVRNSCADELEKVAARHTASHSETPRTSHD